MKQGQIHFYTAGHHSKDMVLQQNDYYQLVATIEPFGESNDFRFRLTKVTDGTASYQESFLTREELLKLVEHIQNVTR